MCPVCIYIYIYKIQISADTMYDIVYDVHTAWFIANILANMTYAIVCDLLHDMLPNLSLYI